MLLGNVLGSFLGIGGTGADGTGNPLGNVGIWHTGGIPGVDKLTTRPATAATFANAPRFHTGGMPGLRSDEVTAILTSGEGVLTMGKVREPGRSARGASLSQSAGAT